MRPPITYALIPLLVGLPVCATGNLTFENLAGCCSFLALLYWGVNKGKTRSLLYRKIIGMFLGLALVYVCNREEYPRNEELMENEHSNTWKMMPPRELDLTLRITGRKGLRAKNESKYQAYEGYIINSPEVRIDLVGKKVSWIQKKRNDFQEISKGDTVFLCGIIKHRELNKSQKEEKKSDQYYIDQVVISKVMHNTSIFANLRHKIDLKLKGIENKDGKYKGFVYALLFGDRSLLDLGQVSLFKETGTMHLFAVSGLHIGIVYLIFSYILKRIFSARSIWIAGSLLLVFGYVGLVGYASSACRAFVMITMWQISLLLHKKGNPLSALYWAFIVLLLIAPDSLFSLGFQLSFTVVLSILFCYHKKSFSTKGFNLYNFVKNSIIVSYSSFFGSSLLMIDHFHFINPTSIVINIILVNLIFFIFLICLLYVISAFFLGSHTLSFFVESIYSIIVVLLNLFNQFNYLHFRFPKDFDIPNIIHLLYPLLLIIVMPYLSHSRHRLIVVSCLPSVFLLVSLYVNWAM